MSQWFQRFIASSIYGEVSDATIQGYLRSASQIEEVWQQIDDDVDALILQGMPPWDAYAKMGYALAFVRACRTNIVFVQELLKASATANAANGNYLPRVTYDQALALSEHIEPYLEEAIKASTNPHYVPTFPFPLAFGPHIRNANQRFPLPHLQGIIGAAQQMRDWAAGLLAKYELALGAAKTAVPQAVTTHLEQMKAELRLGDFHMRTGTDMVGQISQGQVTDELNDKAEGFLWEAMESYFKVSQLVANPAAPPRPSHSVPNQASQQQQFYGRQAVSPGPNPMIPAQPVPPVPPVSPVPPVPSMPPTPPEPDISAMLNEVIAEPGPTEHIPTQPSPDVSAMLNQVISAPGPTQSKSPPPPDVSGMLNQVISEPEAIQDIPEPPAPDVPDLLSPVTSEPTPTQSVPTPPASKKSSVEAHEQQQNKPTSEDNLLELLSDICGEQKESD